MEKREGFSERTMRIFEEEGIKLPDDFQKKVVQHAQLYYHGQEPGRYAVAATVKICKYWKRYLLDEEEFSKLVCQSVYSMARIHTAVIRSDKMGFWSLYNWQPYKLKEGMVIPDCTITIATYEGRTLKQEGFGMPAREF